MKAYDRDMEEAANVLYEHWGEVSRVAKCLGVSRQTVRRWVVPGAREQHNQSQVDKRMSKYPSSVVAEAKQLYADGVKRATIARRLGVNVNTINYWVVPGAREKHNRRQAEEYAASPDREEPTANRCPADFEGLNDRIAGHRARVHSACSSRLAG